MTKKHMTNKQKRKLKHKQEKQKDTQAKTQTHRKIRAQTQRPLKKTLYLTFVMKKEWFTKDKPWRRHIVPAR